jgi:polyhydroxyalkanoate synthesis regulator phasin
MKTLEEHALDYADKHNQSYRVQDHIIQFCTESKWIEIEKIKAQIEILHKCTYVPRSDWDISAIGKKIIELEQKLEQLEDENT